MTTNTETSITQIVELLTNNASYLDEEFFEDMNDQLTLKVKQAKAQKLKTLLNEKIEKLKTLLNEKKFDEAKELFEANKNKTTQLYQKYLRDLFVHYIDAKEYEVVEWILKNLTEYFHKNYFEHKFVSICERQNLEVANIFNNFDPIKYQFSTKTTEKINEVISCGKTYSNIDNVVFYDSEDDY